MINALTDAFATAQALLFEMVVQPAAFALGFGQWLELAYEGTGWLLVGLLQLAVMLLVLVPLEHWRPAQAHTQASEVRNDVIYTLVHRLGLFRLGLFFSIDPAMDSMLGPLRAAGWGSFHLDDLWPGVSDLPWVAFALYLVVFDALGYLIHRGQHHWAWWWSLHALHHSQRSMTVWTDNRNHVLDDVLVAVIWALVAQCLGVPPGQFVALVACTQMLESLQHTNVRMSFGKWGEALLVSPRFHRWHHSVGLGHESGPFAAPAEPIGVGGIAHGSPQTRPQARASGVLGGHNFGVLLPWWDWLLGTLWVDSRYPATGIRDQCELGRDYGQGIWAQQWLGLSRLWQSLRGKA